MKPPLNVWLILHARATFVAAIHENDLDWLLEPFTCSARMKTSPTEMVLGTGLGDTGTRSVAAAVDALGIPSCHRTYTTADLLLNSTRYDFSAFERTGARAYFDTPMAFLWPRLACAFPNYKIVHTTRLHYSRHYSGDKCDGRGARLCGIATPSHRRTPEI